MHTRHPSPTRTHGHTHRSHSSSCNQCVYTRCQETWVALTKSIGWNEKYQDNALNSVDLIISLQTTHTHMCTLTCAHTHTRCQPPGHWRGPIEWAETRTEESNKGVKYEDRRKRRAKIREEEAEGWSTGWSWQILKQPEHTERAFPSWELIYRD